MKKLTLFAIALLASAVSFAALNPFAYGLSSKLSADETTLTVNYSLNADATAVSVVILDGETVVKTVDCADKGLTKGAYEVEIPTTDFPKTKSLTWKVEVTGAAVEAPTEHPTKYGLYHPSAVDIDNNPENPTFGLILVNEAMHSIKGNNSKEGYKDYLSYNTGAGIYALNPAFEPIENNSGTYGYNGGIEFTNGRYDASGSTAYAPRRIRISEDGRIFVTSLNTDGNYLWEVNPANMNEWTPVFKGTRNAQAELVDAEGNFIAAPNVGFDVKGSGENLQLLMLSCNLNGFAFAYSGYQTHEYNLGNAKEWTTIPSKKVIGGKYIISYTSAQVEYDNEGGMWICQNRSAAKDAEPSLIHINAEGVEDYKEVVNNRMNAGIRFNKNFTKLLVAGVDEGTTKSKKATIYAISKDTDGKPVLTQELVIDMATVGNNLNDFAFDYAGNLYSCGNSAEKLVAWAMPYSGTVSTPCASKYAFQLQEEVVGTFYTVTANANDPAMGEITDNDGQYTAGATATLTAVPAAGYKFVNWTVGEETKTENPLILTVNSDLTITANFAALPQYTITATANDAAMGTVEGAGKYYEGKEVTLKAIANPGHEFVDWNNGATEATLTFAAEKDSAVVANFKKLSYTVTAVVNDDAKGSVAGAGTYDYGTEVELTATPAEGYELLYWSDRSTENPRTVTVDGNKALSAYFVKAYTQEPTFTIEKLWENTNVPSSTLNGYQAVGWDGKVYMQNQADAKVMLYVNGTDAATEHTTSGSGYQIAVDEVGNLIVFNAIYYSSNPNAILIYKKGSTEGKAISFTLPNPGRCDFFSASGNIYSAEGGYVYFYCSGHKVVNRLKITNGAATATDVTVDAVGNTTYAANSTSHVMVDIFGNLVAHCRSNAVNAIDVLTNETKTFTLPNIKMSTLGGCSFELGGKEFWAYNVGTTNYNSEWNIYNMTDGAFLSDTVFYAKNKTDKNSAANWLNVQVVDEKTAYIYQFCPKVAVAVWKVTCDTGEEPGTGTAVDNTTVAPQVQKIIRDGQVLIIRDGKTFNMMGQEVH